METDKELIYQIKKSCKSGRKEHHRRKTDKGDDTDDPNREEVRMARK